MLSHTHTHTVRYAVMYSVGVCIDWAPLRFICRFLAAKFVILRNWWVLLAAASVPLPLDAALPGLAPTAPGRHFINMQQATCECCALSSHPISPGLNQFHPSRSPHRTQTMPFNAALRGCVCVCVRWLVYCGACPPSPSPFPSARLHLSKWVSFSWCRVSSCSPDDNVDFCLPQQFALNSQLSSPPRTRPLACSVIYVGSFVVDFISTCYLSPGAYEAC